VTRRKWTATYVERYGTQCDTYCDSACVRNGEMALQIEGSSATPMWQVVRDIEESFEQRMKQSEPIPHRAISISKPDNRRRR